ncbi:MAG: lipid II:glycine glycyltransferase FemX [Anaerorhabdus sp.]
MYTFTTAITKEEYLSFISQQELAHYSKTPFWADFQTSTRHYVGLNNGNELVASAMILERKWFGLPYFYIPAGPCLDIHNYEVFSKLLNGIIEFSKQRKAFMIRLDPNIQRVSRDIYGTQTDEISNEFITEFLIQQGFKHKGYGYAYNGSWTNRFTLVLDIQPNYDEIFNKFIKSRQNRLRRHDIMGISSRLANPSELHHLCLLEKDLSEAQGFKPHSVAFFQKLLSCFKDNSQFYLTEVDLSILHQNTLDELNSNKYAKDKEAYASKKKSLTTIEALQQQFGQKAVIAGGITLYFGKQAWNLYLYNKKEFTFLNGSDNTHIFSIQDLKSRGITSYDLCGFSGNSDKNDPYYGLYNYKSSFGTKFIEYIGEFDYINSEKKYNFFISSYRHYRRLYRKITTLRYTKKN